MQLVIGNKNYSSWSLRPWLLMRQSGIAFEEVMLRFDGFGADSNFTRALAAYTPAGRVPVLIDDPMGAGALHVWDSLAIAEYLAERFPERRLWPTDHRARARARSVCAEMHSGFAALRSHCPMNVEASMPELGPRLLREQPALAADRQRIVALLGGLLDEYGGPMLFGPGFGIADAYFAPVCSRLRTYGLPVPARIAAYVEAIHALPAMQAWTREACEEHDFLPFTEPYRSKA